MDPFPLPVRLLGDDVVALRSWRADDAPVKASSGRDPDLVRWAGIPAGHTEQEAQAQTIWAETERQAGHGVSLAIADASTERVLGSCHLRRPERDDPALGEIGYALDGTARGRGYATRAIALLIDWGFDELGMRRIQALVHPENPRSLAYSNASDSRPKACFASTAPTPPVMGIA